MDKNRYIRMVSKTLYDREDKFPDKETHGQTNLKCTNGWLTGVLGNYAVGKVGKFVSNETSRYHDKVSGKLQKLDNPNRLTTKRDVRAGNRLLRMILIDCGC